jgi:two-component system response regulator HupR/HoxA
MSHDETRRPCLLVVDDEPLNRELLRRVLSREYDVEEAADGQAALHIMERRGDDVRVILCDQLMPGLSGTQLAAKINQRWPETYFILLTGYDDDPVVTAAVDRGDVGEVLAKPWRSKMLKERIHHKFPLSDA